MGIYDRDYVRDRRGAGPSPGAGVRTRVASVGMWSVNTWIIVANIAIYVLNLLLPMVGVVVGSRTLGDGTVQPVVAQMHALTAYGHFSTATGFMQLEVWRLVTFQFLHANFTHLFFNMFGMFIFGGVVEQYLGPRKYAAYYLVCGIFGGLTYLLLNLLGLFGVAIPGVLINNVHTPLIGASAGVFGVIVACAYIIPNSIVQLIFPPIPLKMKWLAYGYVGIAVLNLLRGSANAGGEAAHVGGAVAGYFFIRRSHLLRDFFDVFKDSRKKPGGSRPPSYRSEEQELDRVLDKVQREGIGSLSAREKKILQRGTRKRRET